MKVHETFESDLNSHKERVHLLNDIARELK